MKFILITSEIDHKEEAEAVNMLFGAGLGVLHLRKVGWDLDKTKCFIEQIEPRYRQRVVLHDHYSLMDMYALGGVHLNARNCDKVKNYPVNSDSLHSAEELKRLDFGMRYHFLSPIFDSVSKKGYRAAFSTEQIKEMGVDRNIIALGGITEENIDRVAQLGFGGIAMVGHFWQEWQEDRDNAKLVERYLRIQKRCNSYKVISKLHYISPPTITETEILIESICKMFNEGTPLIQIRNKKMTPQQITSVAREVVKESRRLNLTTIVNDNPHIAIAAGADGVHLGREDMSPTEARALMGNNYIIGGTANTFEDVARLHSQGVDYIGLGPFRFTTTKERLSPILGLDGYEKIIKQCREQNINTPIVAIGGVSSEDIVPLMQSGIWGIALSSGLTTETLRTIKNRIYSS